MSARKTREERAALLDMKAKDAAERAAWARIEAAAHARPIVGVLWSMMRKLEGGADVVETPEQVKILQGLDQLLKDSLRDLGLEVPQ